VHSALRLLSPTPRLLVTVGVVVDHVRSHGERCVVGPTFTRWSAVVLHTPTTPHTYTYCLPCSLHTAHWIGYSWVPTPSPHLHLPIGSLPSPAHTTHYTCYIARFTPGFYGSDSLVWLHVPGSWLLRLLHTVTFPLTLPLRTVALRSRCYHVAGLRYTPTFRSGCCYGCYVTDLLPCRTLILVPVTQRWRYGWTLRYGWLRLRYVYDLRYMRSPHTLPFTQFPHHTFTHVPRCCTFHTVALRWVHTLLRCVGCCCCWVIWVRCGLRFTTTRLLHHVYVSFPFTLHTHFYTHLPHTARLRCTGATPHVHHVPHVAPHTFLIYSRGRYADSHTLVVTTGVTLRLRFYHGLVYVPTGSRCYRSHTTLRTHVSPHVTFVTGWLRSHVTVAVALRLRLRWFTFTFGLRWRFTQVTHTQFTTHMVPHGHRSPRVVTWIGLPDSHGLRSRTFWTHIPRHPVLDSR